MPITIGNLTENVRLMLGNRLDIDVEIKKWIHDAYVEIAMGYPHEELEGTVSMILTKGVYSFPYPTSVRAIKSITLFDYGKNLRKKNIKYLDRIPPTSTPGTPSIYANHIRELHIRATPDKDYNAILRVWLLPVITDPVENTIVALPLDWIEIVELAAEMRGHSYLLERDKAAEIKGLLYGASEPNTGRYIPGLIKQRQTQKQAEAPDEDWEIRPRVRSYI